MVAKKRQSKRLTTRKRINRDKKVKDKIKAQKKVLKLKERTRTPSSVLRTDEEIKTYEMIREGVKQRQKEYEQQQKEEIDIDTSFKSYMNQINSVISKSDVIFEIIDARDPISSRDKKIEEKIINSGKKLVLVMNKIDLVPKMVVNEWHAICKESFPTIIYHRKFSKDEIFNILKNYSRSENGEIKITVGVIGYPNVGKSTFINTLIRSDSCNTGSKAGITKDIQTVSLEKNIQILDCPGVIFNKQMNLMNVLRNSVDINKVDVIKYTDEILQLIDKNELMMFYEIKEFETTKEFLNLLGNKYKLFKKKGVIDFFESGKRFIREISNGKIGFYTIPVKKDNEILGESNVHYEGKVLFTFRI